jgi:hypothetical protein
VSSSNQSTEPDTTEDQSVRRPTRIKNSPVQSLGLNDNKTFSSARAVRQRTSPRKIPEKISEKGIPEVQVEDCAMEVDDDFQSGDEDGNFTSELSNPRD